MFASPLLLGAVAVEGYVVLAVELLAIRQLTPYVGNATDTVAIVIAAVLLPLAFGYEAGGRVRFAPGRAPGGDAAGAPGADAPEIARADQGLGGSPDRGASPGAGPEAGVRRRLTRNLLLAALILSFGLSHPYLVAFFGALDGVGITHRLVQTALHAGLFLVYPVYLLGQTVPLVAHCSTGASLPRSTGLMLFFSTFGSFLGSVVSTLVLMTFWGVHATVAFTLGLLVLLAGLIGRRTWARAKQVPPEKASFRHRAGHRESNAPAIRPPRAKRTLRPRGAGTRAERGSAHLEGSRSDPHGRNEVSPEGAKTAKRSPDPEGRTGAPPPILPEEAVRASMRAGRRNTGVQP